MMQAAGARRTDANSDAQADDGGRPLPTVVIVTADAGLEVVADELRQCAISCMLVKSVAELGEMVRAMTFLKSSQPKP
jgi:hypothetical protein